MTREPITLPSPGWADGEACGKWVAEWVAQGATCITVMKDGTVHITFDPDPVRPLLNDEWSFAR